MFKMIKSFDLIDWLSIAGLTAFCLAVIKIFIVIAQ